jgi:hypothetical protein
MRILAASSAALYRPNAKGGIAEAYQSVKSLDVSSFKACHLAEQQEKSEDKQVEAIKANTHLVNLPRRQAEITQARNALVTFTTGCIMFFHVRNHVYALFKAFGLLQRQKAPMLLKAAVLEPELAVVKANLTLTESLTSQQLRAFLDCIFPQTYRLLETGQHALAGDFSQMAQCVKTLFGDYVQKLNSLEIILRQGGYSKSQNPSCSHAERACHG